MALFEKWFARGSDGEPDIRFDTSGPVMLGNLLVTQFRSDERPFITDAELADLSDKFSPEIRMLLEPWILVYLAWLLRVFAAAKYGDEFGRAMMASVYERIAIFQDGSVAGGIQYWFKQLDKTLRESIESPVTIGGVEVAPSRYFALCFLSRDSGSPYANNPNPDFQGVDIDVADALDNALTIANPRLASLISKASNLPR